MISERKKTHGFFLFQATARKKQVQSSRYFKFTRKISLRRRDYFAVKILPDNFGAKELKNTISFVH